MQDIYEEVMKIKAEGKSAALATIIGTKGSTPRQGGGVMDFYHEPLVPTPRVFIFGGGHISLFVARMSAMVGFQVVVVDDRPQFANKERFPEADEVIAEEFPLALPKLKGNKASYIVIVTRGHSYDREVLEWAGDTEGRYNGRDGRRKKN